jgi:hypothetical protein
VVEFVRGWGAPRYSEEERTILDRDLGAVQSRSIVDFRGLHRFTQSAIGWAVGTVLAENPGLPMTPTVGAVMEIEQPKAWAILLGLSHGVRSALSDRVKALNFDWTPEVRELWSLNPIGGPKLPIAYEARRD